MSFPCVVLSSVKYILDFLVLCRRFHILDGIYFYILLGSENPKIKFQISKSRWDVLPTFLRKKCAQRRIDEHMSVHGSPASCSKLGRSCIVDCKVKDLRQSIASKQIYLV